MVGCDGYVRLGGAHITGIMGLKYNLIGAAVLRPVVFDY